MPPQKRFQKKIKISTMASEAVKVAGGAQEHPQQYPLGACGPNGPQPKDLIFQKMRIKYRRPHRSADMIKKDLINKIKKEILKNKKNRRDGIDFAGGSSIFIEVIEGAEEDATTQKFLSLHLKKRYSSYFIISILINLNSKNFKPTHFYFKS